MLRVKCIQKFRDNHNLIKGYRLMDSTGNTKDVTPQQLKQAIKLGKIDIVNLKLTSDDRLIDKDTNKIVNKVMDINKLMLKLKVAGAKFDTMNTACGHKIYQAITKEKECILIIPDDVTMINFDYNDKDIAKFSVEKVLRVYGGKNLKYAPGLFSNCRFYTMNLSNFYTSNIEDASGMFFNCQAKSLDLSHFDTSEMTNMSDMFRECQVKYLDLSNFNTSKVTDMSNMFNNCEATSINLSSFDTSQVETMKGMFMLSSVTSVDLSNFNTRKVTDMSNMFFDCQATYLDISNFIVNSDTYTSEMFDYCRVESIKLNDKELKEIWDSRLLD